MMPVYRPSGGVKVTSTLSTSTTPTLHKAKIAAKRLGIDLNRFRALVRRGYLPRGLAVRVGREILVDMAELESFIKAGGGKAL
jgi:hypothetical protein